MRSKKLSSKAHAIALRVVIDSKRYSEDVKEWAEEEYNYVTEDASDENKEYLAKLYDDPNAAIAEAKNILSGKPKDSVSGFGFEL